MRSSFVQTLVNEVKKNPKIILLTGDLGFGVLKPFQDALPNNYLNCGIAEANMVSFAAGLASQGYIPVIYSIGNFPTVRVLEQIRNDVCYQNKNVKIVCIGGGYTYGTLGATHHATEDIAIMRSLPNMRIFTPSTKDESTILTKEMLRREGPVYLRLERNSPVDFNSNIDKEDIFKPAQFIAKRNKTLVLSYGTIMEILVNLKNADVFSMPVIKPLNEKELINLFRKYKHIITVEEHNVIGGLGDSIASIIAENNIGIKLDKFGINDEYPHIVGDQECLRKHEHITLEDVQSCVDNGKK